MMPLPQEKKPDVFFKKTYKPLAFLLLFFNFAADLVRCDGGVRAGCVQHLYGNVPESGLCDGRKLECLTI